MQKIKTFLVNIFTQHPGEIGETYWRHLLFTVTTAFRIIICGFAILLHGIFPFICTHTAGRMVESIYLTLKKRILPERLSELDWDI